jgi:hypothetical protein
MLRLIVGLVALVGGFILVAMLVAPSQPHLRVWYLENACPTFDKLSTDICAALHRGTEKKA